MSSPAPAYPAVVVVGPTASGKSNLALTLAEAFDGEIVNYDSIQVFRHLDIGTGKPSLEDRRRVSHHLIDILEPDEPFSAGEYQRRARDVLDDIRTRHKLPILVGGTGLYLRAVMEGLFDGPHRSNYWRARMQAVVEEKGREYLHRTFRWARKASSAHPYCRRKAVRPNLTAYQEMNMWRDRPWQIKYGWF